MNYCSAIDFFLIFMFCCCLMRFTNGTLLEDAMHYDSCDGWISSGVDVPGNCTRSGKSLNCYGSILNVHHKKATHIKKVEHLTICGWPTAVFNANELRGFPKIQTLRIEYGNLSTISHEFPDLEYLEYINISWTNLVHIKSNLFRRLPNLKYLDLRWNALDHIMEGLLLPRHFEELYMNGNPWNCTRNFKWLLHNDKAEHVVDRELLTCADTKYTSRHLMTVMQFKQNLKEECKHEELKNCTCSMHYIRLNDDGKTLKPVFTVNCSHLNLYNFPSYLPKNTSIFYANDNLITEVKSLRMNPSFRAVQDVYLDNNQIQSIDVLEAGFWLHNFRVLSLRGNKMTNLPVYALDDALEQNEQASKMYLSGNPWTCNCKFTLRFRELLMKYHTIIKDYKNVTCKYIEGDNNFLKHVLELDRHDVCRIPVETKFQPLDLLNGVLGLLIILVLGKLAYDYYHYKKYGRLPWIVTKIP